MVLAISASNLTVDKKTFNRQLTGISLVGIIIIKGGGDESMNICKNSTVDYNRKCIKAI